MHYCPLCEIGLPDNARFCSHCGFTLETTTVVKRAVNKKQFPLVNVQPADGSTVAAFSRKVLDGTHIQYCPSCEAELTYNARFCSHCGLSLEATRTLDDAANMKTPPPVDVKPLDGSTIGSRISSLGYKVLGKLPMPAQHVIAAVLTRIQDPKPEEFPTGHPKAVASQVLASGWLPPMLVLISTLGVLSVAYACTSSRFGVPGVEIFFWLGLALIFAPVAARLISPVASRFERISLLCVAGICFYLVKVIVSPLYFSNYDEFLHWRSANDIANSGHLFSSINALLPVSPFYPGLEIVTNALSSLSGLDTFISGIIVVGVARLVMILSLFMLYELVTHSARIAGIAVLIYMTNPHFLFFDASFSYESLALPLATFMLFALARHETLKRERYQITFVAWIALGAVIVTHHLTDFIFLGLLLLWVVIHTSQRSARRQPSNLLKTALLGVFMSLVWISLGGNPVVDYLSSYFTSALREVLHILTGSSSGRQLFVDYAGGEVPLLQRIMEAASIALISLGLPFGLLCLWQRYRHNALACMLGIVSLLYPMSNVFRFTNFGAEITTRSSAFLFIPIGCVLAIFITQFWPTRKLNWMQISLVTCAISLVFLGAVPLGSGPVFGILPGTYLVSADARSIEIEGIQTARYTNTHLGSNNRVATDRINGLLMSTYGNQRLVTKIQDNIDITPIFFSSNISPYEISILQDAKIRYLVVDLRLSKALPLVGFYYDPEEPGSFQHTTPIDPADLTKFGTIPKINRVFDSGDIIIYDVGGLTNAPEKP